MTLVAAALSKRQVFVFHNQASGVAGMRIMTSRTGRLCGIEAPVFCRKVRGHGVTRQAEGCLVFLEEIVLAGRMGIVAEIAAAFFDRIMDNGFVYPVADEAMTGCAEFRCRLCEQVGIVRAVGLMAAGTVALRNRRVHIFLFFPRGFLSVTLCAEVFFVVVQERGMTRCMGIVALAALSSGDRTMRMGCLQQGGHIAMTLEARFLLIDGRHGLLCLNNRQRAQGQDSDQEQDFADVVHRVPPEVLTAE